MISTEYKGLLLNKVADSLIEYLKQTSEEMLAKTHIDRLRRLRTDGQISHAKLQQGIRAAQKNEKLPLDMRDSLEKELSDLNAKYESEKRSSGSIQMHNDAKNLATANLVDANSSDRPTQYVSAEVIVPASVSSANLKASGWFAVEGGELAGFLEQINPVDDVLRVSPTTTLCHWHTLPWYDNVALIRLVDPEWSNQQLVLYYLTLAGNLFRLNGTSPPIHEINAKAPINLTSDNAADYLRFFCFFVRAEEGPFYLVENEKDPLLPSFDDPDAQQIMGENAAPIELKGQDENGNFEFKGTVFYSNALFEANLLVQSSGMIEMIDDSPVAADLPKTIYAPIKEDIIH